MIWEEGVYDGWRMRGRRNALTRAARRNAFNLVDASRWSFACSPTTAKTGDEEQWGCGAVRCSAAGSSQTIPLLNLQLLPSGFLQVAEGDSYKWTITWWATLYCTVLRARSSLAELLGGCMSMTMSASALLKDSFFFVLCSTHSLYVYRGSMQAASLLASCSL